MQSTVQISSQFIWRRLHSLMGLWLVIYLILHLVTNSQAALWFGEDGSGFVRMVNSLESLPYLHAIEIVLIGVPFAIHMVWGIHRAFTAKTNAATLHYGRNQAFTWQRITSWILLFGVIGHVVQMRFIDQPKTVEIGYKKYSAVAVSMDSGLEILSRRLNFAIYNGNQPADFSVCNLKPNQVLAVADSPGTAMLLMVRDTFKSPMMVGCYTIFLLSAAFHAFNGFWTFLITWGAILSIRSQKAMIPVSVIGMGLLTFLGLAAIFGSYWMSQYG